MANLKCKSIGAYLWKDVESFFMAERCSGCWCINHRMPNGQAPEGDQAKNLLNRLIEDGKIYGAVAFDGDRAVGWMAYDPMLQLAGLDCRRPDTDQSLEGVWSIHCISVLSQYHKEAVSELMLKHGLSDMKEKGARLIEAYPPPDVPSPNTFSGSMNIYLQHGFRQIEKVSQFYVRMALGV
jgi:hypothetical protein